MTNEERAHAALTALIIFNEHMPNGELEETVADLLCDLMHLLDSPRLGLSHLDFNEEIQKAQFHYYEEIKGEKERANSPENESSSRSTWNGL